MPLDFPSSPVNGQVYDNFYYDANKKVWKSVSSGASPNYLVNSTIIDAIISAKANTQSTVPVSVKGAASQTANLQEWKNSSDIVLASVTSSGEIRSSLRLSAPDIILTTPESTGQTIQVRGRQTDNFSQIAWYKNNGSTFMGLTQVMPDTSFAWVQNTSYASDGTNLVERVRISPNGHLLSPYNPSFSVHSTQATTQGNDIVWDQVTFNVGSYYNSSNGRFTAPTSGYYYMHAHGLWNYSVTGDIRVSLYKNGTGFPGMRTIETKTAQGWVTWHINGIVYMAAGDYATVRVDQLTGGMHTDAGYNQFSGYLVG